MDDPIPEKPKSPQLARGERAKSFALAALGIATAGVARAETTAGQEGGQATTLPAIEVTGTVDTLPQDIPQSMDTLGHDLVTAQDATKLEDALRNVPGITINAGEGGSHGDSLNLRGISVPDSFFVDGLRDIGLYQRDTFDEEAAEVLLGPSSVLFGRGSTAGVINQVSKLPTLVPEQELTAAVGTAGLYRETADLDWAFGNSVAARLNLMDEHAGVADRDYVLNKKSGVAPALEFGINTPTTLTLTYLHQKESDLPDYGIPFIDGAPAHVDRGNYYGLVNYDHTGTSADIGTARLETRINDHLSFEDSLRYAHYSFEYLLSAPHLDDDYTEPPAPGTPLDQILVYRDQPSSAGDEEELVDHADLTAKFDTGLVGHSLVAGVELSRETSDVLKYINGIDVIPPTSLVDPDPYYSPPTSLGIDTHPRTVGTDVSFDLMDSMRLTAQWDLDAGVRWDRFNSHYSESTTGSSFEEADTEVSPRAALIFKPEKGQSYYLSYGESYNPAIEYLTLAPSDQSISPEKDKTVELGAKVGFLGGSLDVTGAVFDTMLDNARNADPDDPTVQQVPFSQSVKGIEIGVKGHLTRQWEISAGYTHLEDTISQTTDPLAAGRKVPNVAPDSGNLWLSWEPGRAFKLAGGLNYSGSRFADTYNTAGVPSYVVFNAMASYHVNEHLELQVNLNNVADKLYYSSVYYTELDENHAVPGPGRTLVVSAKVHF